jgi:hypothetical protein
VGQAGARQRQGRHERPPAAAPGAVHDAQEQQRQPDPVLVRELARHHARDRPAPDRVVLEEQEHEGGRRTQQRTGEAEPEQPERRVREEREQDDRQRRADLEGGLRAQERRERRHHQERQREVVEQQRVAEVAAGVPAVEARCGKQALAERRQGRVVARHVAAGGDRGQQQQRGPQVVGDDEEQEGQAESVSEPGAPAVEHG